MYTRFIIFFSLLVVFISVYFAYTSISFTSKIINALETRQVARLAQVLLQRGNFLDEEVLARLQRMMGGEVFIYRTDGLLLASTLKNCPSKLAKIPADVLKRLKRGEPVVNELRLKGRVYRLVLLYTRLSEDISCICGLLLPATFETKVKKELVFGLSYTTFSGLVFMLIVSWYLCRWITSPLEKLVQTTRKLAHGNLAIRAPEKGPPEVRELAQALNDMSHKLHEYQQRLIETERLATAAQLAASLAHEIKNPLTSLRLAAELLSELLKDQPELAARAELIMRESKRLEGILQRMLERTRKVELHKAPCNLNDLVQEVMETAKLQFKARRQQLALDLATPPPLTMADAERLKQVLWNILNNASEATPQGGQIIIRTHNRSPEEVALIVEDSGPGVPEEDLNKLYKPFYTTKKDGTGLGLAISRQIVLLHGGQLLFENRKEGGLKVTVILPRLPVQSEGKAPPS